VIPVEKKNHIIPAAFTTHTSALDRMNCIAVRGEKIKLLNIVPTVMRKTYSQADAATQVFTSCFTCTVVRTGLQFLNG
jgi:hypothetical protein